MRFENLEGRLDDRLRGAALQTLIGDWEDPADGIDTKVADVWVTLPGDVECQFQSDAALNDTASVRGAVGLTNEIKVSTRKGRQCVHHGGRRHPGATKAAPTP